eukprot:5280735-Lingulodinium_polyedra.AAC.1
MAQYMQQNMDAPPSREKGDPRTASPVQGPRANRGRHRKKASGHVKSRTQEGTHIPDHGHRLHVRG